MRQRISFFLLWIITVIRLSKIKIVALIIALVSSVYLFTATHTRVVFFLGGKEYTEDASLSQAFLYYINHFKSSWEIGIFFHALPFLIIFYPMILIVQPNLYNTAVRIFYIVQGLILLYLAWYVSFWMIPWKIHLDAYTSGVQFFTNFNHKIILTVNIIIGLWSIVKGVLPRLGFVD